MVANIMSDCEDACMGRYVVCLQDTTAIDLSNHRKRIKKDDHIGTINANSVKGLRFFLHFSFVVDVIPRITYGYSNVNV
jgi:hypothetical protein